MNIIRAIRDYLYEDAPTGSPQPTRARLHGGNGRPRAQSRSAIDGHDARRLEEAFKGGVREPHWKMLQQNLQEMCERLRTLVGEGGSVRAAVPADARGDQVRQREQPSHANADAPEFREKPVVQAIRQAFPWRIGATVLAGAGLIGLAGGAGLGILGATSAVFGVASIGLLGAALYAGHRHHQHLFFSPYHSAWPLPLPAFGQCESAWGRGAYLPPMTQANGARVAPA